VIREPIAFEGFLENIRRFVRDVAIPAEPRVETDDSVPDDIVDIMRREGLFGWSIPETHGGAGLTTEELVLAAFELSQCAVAFRARVGTNTGIGSEGIVADGTEEQKRRYLPRLASGAWTGCLAVTEPDAGSEATNVRTAARRGARATSMSSMGRNATSPTRLWLTSSL
jgi:acyl-CoA dehydrogenase